jgi:hypothetical protein
MRMFRGAYHPELAARQAPKELPSCRGIVERQEPDAIPGRHEANMVKRKTPSPKAKKAIVKHMVKDAKKLRSAYAKGKKKKFLLPPV